MDLIRWILSMSISMESDSDGDPIIGSDEYTSQLGIRVGNILGTHIDDVEDDLTNCHRCCHRWSPILRSGHDYTRVYY